MSEDKAITFPQEKQNFEKASRFKALASKRTTNVLHDMDVLQKCFDQNSYEYNDEQIGKIFHALETKLSALKMASKLGSNKTQFTL